MQRSVHVEDIEVRQSNVETAAPDRRVRGSRWSLDSYGVDFYRADIPSDAAAFDGGPIVEVQAFIAAGYEVSRQANVTIGLMGRKGHASIQLSPSEARAVALSLLQAAVEAEMLMDGQLR
jgi:hypothetical protein